MYTVRKRICAPYTSVSRALHTVFVSSPSLGPAETADLHASSLAVLAPTDPVKVVSNHNRTGRARPTIHHRGGAVSHDSGLA
jgi:hypothetical protein